MNRAKSLGLLLLFAVLYLLVSSQVMRVAALLGLRGLTVSSAIALASAVSIGAVLLVRVERRPFAALGLAWREDSTRDIIAGMLLPGAALLLAVVLMLVTGALRYQNDSGDAITLIVGAAQLLVVLAIAAAAEEALFRGYPFQKLATAIGPVAATLMASAGFALAHINNPNVNAFALANIFVAGVMLSVAYLRTRSLWLPIALHTSWNWWLAGPFDLPVSGLELFDTPLYEPRMTGADWLTGGDFGPEGGVAGLIALLLLTAAVWALTKSRPSTI